MNELAYQREQRKIDDIKKMYSKGTRVILKQMEDDYAVPPLTKGTVDFVDDEGTIFVEWDNGSNLGLIYGIDDFEIINENEIKMVM